MLTYRIFVKKKAYDFICNASVPNVFLPQRRQDAEKKGDYDSGGFSRIGS